MENVLKASNFSYKPSLIPREVTRVPLAPKQPSPQDKPEAKSFLYEAVGPGLRLCAPKCPASFLVECTAAQVLERRKLKVGDLKASIKGNVTVKTDIKQIQEGVLEVTYTAPLTGEYRVLLSVGSTAVHGSPFRMSCQQPRACEQHSRLSESIEDAFANERYSLPLRTHDQFGNIFTGKADIRADVLDSTTVLFQADILELGPGRYEVAFTPQISGSYGLSISFDNNRVLRGCPVIVRVRNDETCAPNCKLYGAGLTQGIAGEQSIFSIQACDAKTNARSVGGDSFSISFPGPALQPPMAHVKDNLDGTYQVHWSTDIAGTYLIEAQFEGASLAGCPIHCIVVPGGLDPSRCTCSGEGLAHASAGQPTSFKLHTVDCYDNTRTQGGDGFTLTAQLVGETTSASAAIQGKVEDLGQGLYRAGYVANVAGSYEVKLTSLDGKHVQGSPFQCLVRPGEADAGSSRLYGPGLQAIQLGKPSSLFLQLADQWGNAVDADSLIASDIKVAVDGPQSTPVQAGAVRAGVCSFSYHAHAAGTYTVTATVYGANVCNSPAVVVASIAKACPSQCEVKGCPLTLSLAAGETAAFTIVAKDSQGIQKSLGGDKFAVSWRHNGTNACTTGKVEDLGSGEYKAYFTATAAGNYSVSACLNGSNIAGSPFAAEVASVEADAACSFAAGDGVLCARSGHSARIVVKPQDAFSNPVIVRSQDPSQAGFHVGITGPGNTQQATWDLAAARNGELAATYLPIQSGSCSIAVKYRGQHVQNSPYQVTVEPDTGEAPQSSMSGLQPFLVAGVPQQLAVTARDAQGNLTTTVDAVEVLLDSTVEGLHGIPVKHEGQGHYTAEVCCRQAGIISVMARLNGKSIGQPVTLPVKASKACQLHCTGKGPVSCTAGRRAEVMLQSQDTFGNLLKEGGALVQGHIVAQGATPAGVPQPCQVADRGNGLYALSFSSQTAGRFEVRGWLQGIDASTVTLQGHCEPAVTCMLSCHTQLLSELTAGQQGELVIWQHDQYGNKVTRRAAPGLFLAQATGPGIMQSDVMLHDNGKVTIRLLGAIAGNYSLSVANKVGDNLKGSPFAIAVQPGPISAAHSSVQLLQSGSILAGTELQLKLNAVDMFANQVQSMDSSALKAHAEGPELVNLKQTETPLLYSARVEKAGAYLVHSTISNVPVASSPELMHVQPASASAARCKLLGCNQHMVAGHPLTLTLHVHDEFGNARTQGGDRVHVDLEGPASTVVTAATVEDFGNGVYNIQFVPDLAGQWRVVPRVNGAATQPGGYEMHAVFAPVSARDCVLETPGSAELTVGTTSRFQLKIANAERLARRLDGTEHVTAYVSGSLQSKYPAAVQLAEDCSHYKVECFLGHHLGSVQLHVQLGGQAVFNSPLSFSLRPGPVSLDRLTVRGVTSACTAGETRAVTICALDAYGHATALDGTAVIMMQIASGADIVDVTAKHKQGAEYSAAFTLTKAGPLRATVSIEGQQGHRAFEGICKPANLSVAHCEVISFDKSLTAGETGQLKLHRRDRYGNFAAAPAASSLLVKVADHSGNQEGSVFDLSDATIVQYTCQQAGEAKVWIGSQNGEQLPGAPFSVCIKPAAMCPRNCQAAILGVSTSNPSITAGSPLHLHLSILDSFGNPTACTQSVVAQIIGGPTIQQLSDGEGAQLLSAGSPLGEQAADNLVGPVFAAEMLKAGPALVEVSVGGVKLQDGWPRSLEVLPNEPSADHCTIRCQNKNVVCGQAAGCTLHTADAFGNVVLTGGANVQGHLSLHTLEVSQRIEVQVCDNHNGTYSLAYNLPLEGQWVLHPTVDGGAVKQHGLMVQAKYGPLQAADISFTLHHAQDAACCGGCCRVQIQAAGRVMTGLDAMTVRACSNSPRAMECHLVEIDADNLGQLQSSWIWSQIGQHQVSVELAGRHVAGSPVSVQVAPAQLCPEACHLTGMTDGPSTGVLSVTLEGRDAYCNACGIDAAQVQVTCQPKAALQHVDVQPGSSDTAVSIHAKAVAQGTLYVKVAHHHINPSGWPILLQPAACSRLAFVGNSQELPGQTTAGDSFEVLVETQDCLHQRICPADACLTAVLTSSTNQTQQTTAVQHTGNGVYAVSAALKQAGSYQLLIQLGPGSDCPADNDGNSAVTSLQCDVVCMPATAAAHCCIVELQSEPWIAGRAAEVAVHQYDRFNNSVADVDGQVSFAVHAQGPGPVHAITDASNPNKVHLVARQAGVYTLTLVNTTTQEVLGRHPIQASVRPAEASSHTSAWTLLGHSRTGGVSHEPVVQAGQELCVEAELRDAYGNMAEVDDAKLTITASGPDGPTILIQKPSTSTFSAQLTAAGTHSLTVSLEGSPFQEAAELQARTQLRGLTVVPAAVCPHRTTVQAIPDRLVAGVSCDFTICPVDIYGNAGASGGLFSATAQQGSQHIPLAITESVHAPRTATACLPLEQAGRWTVTVSHASSSETTGVISSPVSDHEVVVEEAAASADCSRLTGFWPPQGAIAGVPACFVIQAHDSFKNPRQSGREAFTVQVQGVARDSVQVTDRQDGTYLVEYCVPAEGTYQAHVTLNGFHVAGSPASITAFRDIGMLADQEIEARLTSTVSGLRRGIASARGLHASLRSEAKALDNFIPMLVEGARSGITSLLKHQEVALAENKAAYAREALERRRLHNVVQELRGNIRVYVRVKPLSEEEVAVGQCSVLKCHDGHRVQCTALGSTKAFDFDRVFGPEVQQAGIFEDVSQLVTSALDGYNVCIFAYGQTGAGKTHTMEGSQQDPGINYRAMKELFRSIEEERTDAKYAISVSIVEIYNEMVHDLLADQGKADPELQKGPAGFTIPDLTQSEVTSPEQIFEIMQQGFEHRAVGCHDINARSSRSHCLLIIQVAATDTATGVRTVGKLTLCDLAGSERITKTGATGLTLTEAQNINKSLLELGNVISALMQQSKHVPYRNSKLTMLLQDSLGGDAKALMFCNLASTVTHATETLSSLGFASKVSNVVLRTPQRKFQEFKENVPNSRQASKR